MTAWTDLSHDPRVGEFAGLRASDADRDVVQAILSQAYAEGRLTPVEHDQRAAATWQARALGDLRELIADLVPEQEAGGLPAARPRPAWRPLIVGFLLPSIVCVLLWRFAASGLFWPAWVIVYTGLPLLRRWHRR